MENMRLITTKTRHLQRCHSRDVAEDGSVAGHSQLMAGNALNARALQSPLGPLERTEAVGSRTACICADLHQQTRYKRVDCTIAPSHAVPVRSRIHTDCAVPDVTKAVTCLFDSQTDSNPKIDAHGLKSFADSTTRL